MIKILLFGSCYGTGLTSQLAEMPVGFAGLPEVDLQVVTGSVEQYPGLFDILREKGINYTVILSLDIHSEFRSKAIAVGEVIARFQPDVILPHTNWQQAITIVARRQSMHRCLVFHTIHGYRNNEPWKSLIARFLIGMGLYATADIVITPSSFLRRKFAILGSRARLIYIGEDRRFFGEYTPPPDAGLKHLVYPAQFRRGKNQELLIHAIGRYVRETGDGEVRLHLPGQGNRLGACQELVRNLGLQEQVLFPGFLNRDQMMALYQSSACSVVSSSVETFGHCIVEPYVLGRVVISRPVGVAPDILHHGENGFLWKTEDELIAILRELLRDSNRIHQICRRAFAGRDDFRWETICLKHLQILREFGVGISGAEQTAAEQ